MGQGYPKMRMPGKAVSVFVSSLLVVASAFCGAMPQVALGEGATTADSAAMEDVTATYAPSFPVTDAAIHLRSADVRYRTPTLLYETITFSGSGLGAENYFTTTEVESLNSSAFYEQSYSILGEGVHTFTGLPLADVISQLGADVTASSAILIEGADGSSYQCTWSELVSGAYGAYDAAGTLQTSGLPALLACGHDGTPNANGAFSVVFGQTSADDDNASRRIEHVTRIAVGDDVDYCQHVWYPYNVEKYMTGANDLHIRIFRGDNLVKETTFSYLEIEAMARGDRSGIQRGMFSALVYDDDEDNHSGPFTDYYEGYDLYRLLEKAGVPYEPEGTVQFYQTSSFGLENSWKTVNVSLGYLAGNGPAGKGDYSNNVVHYGRDGETNTGGAPIRGVRPMLCYGKNGLPLMHFSGSPGVNNFNYRGPMIAMLPENAAEESHYVQGDTVSSCYIGLIEVYLDDYGADVIDPTLSVSVSTLAPAILTDGDEVQLQTATTPLSYNGDGDIEVTAADESVATATYDPATRAITVSPHASGTTSITVTASAGVTSHEAQPLVIPVAVADIEFMGGSLRADYEQSGGVTDYTRASMRMGYRITPPSGITVESWSWTYGEDPELVSDCAVREGEFFATDDRGSMTSNIVFTSIRDQFYESTIYARFAVVGADASGVTFDWTDAIYSRSVAQVAQAIMQDDTQDASTRAHAQGLLDAMQG